MILPAREWGTFLVDMTRMKMRMFGARREGREGPAGHLQPHIYTIYNITYKKEEMRGITVPYGGTGGSLWELRCICTDTLLPGNYDINSIIYYILYTIHLLLLLLLYHL